MTMLVKASRSRPAGVTEIAHDSNALSGAVLDPALLRQNVVIALAQESSQCVAESVRIYARRARANGDSVQEVLEVLMHLVRDAAPQSRSLSSRSCEVANWAIAAYFGEPAATPMVARGRFARARANQGSLVQDETESSSSTSYPFARYTSADTPHATTNSTTIT